MASYEDIVEELYQPTGNGPLHRAVLLKDEQTAKKYGHLINDVNFKGETPLHLAVKRNEENPVKRILMEFRPNVNARNKWHQTPLHYAVNSGKNENLNVLLNTEGIDIDAKDLNGYTPLLCLVDAHEEASPDWASGFRSLLEAGANRNSKTTYGYGILHLAAAKRNNTNFLSTILDLIPDVDLLSLTTMDENFLHIYMFQFAEVYEIAQEFIEKSLKKEDARALLNQRDAFGNTPFSLVMEDRNFDSNFISTLLSFGADATTTDFLGNTILHRLVCSAASPIIPEIICLVRAGAPTKKTNFFGQSPAALAYEMDVIEFFIREHVDFNQTDAWKRSAFTTIADQKPRPEVIKTLITKGGADVHIRDRYGSTPLHLAAYNDFDYQVDILLSHGADKGAKDEMNDLPWETADRHLCLNSYRRLRQEENESVLYRRVNTMDILGQRRSSVTASEIQKVGFSHISIGFPEDPRSFYENMLKQSLIEPRSEEERIVSTVRKFVGNVCDLVGEYDSRFKVKLIPTGSTAEGTKVGKLDEFDFFLGMEELLNSFDIIKTPGVQRTPYACLKMKPDVCGDLFAQFTTSEGFFVAYQFLQHLYKYIKKALGSNKPWKYTDLSNRCENKIHVIDGKPVFNFVIYWTGSKFKHIKISVDLVPDVYMPGWWPSDILSAKIRLLNQDIRDAGCFLIFQSHENDFHNFRFLEDSLMKLGFPDDKDGKLRRRSKLRVSVAPAEIALMKSLPEAFLRGYAMAKLVKGEHICPEIIVDVMPWDSLSLRRDFEKKKMLPAKPWHIIKSYMLKNCTFRAADQMTHDAMLDADPYDIAKYIFKILLQSCKSKSLVPYLLPYTNVLELPRGTSSYDTEMLPFKRELCAQLGVSILG
ncbi:hypothetical protein FSP39_015068 [Pinctada imbricata]|uniref:Mab-21-like nucleotidyltransferase domain-containing protein n=1 Tax=Pinctada imbricata TaxID=66713 RepID=A0AA88Y3Y7_PINIB|nr:hypothetical protein FSP39_015068 [Pinctada imbricata]